MAVSVHGQPTCAWLASPAPSSGTRVVSGRHAAVTHAPAQRAYARLGWSCALRRLTARAEGKQVAAQNLQENLLNAQARLVTTSARAAGYQSAGGGRRSAGVGAAGG